MDKINAFGRDNQANELKFIDWQWREYKLIFEEKIKKQQIHNLFYSGLCEGPEGLEYSFVPTTMMLDYEIAIKQLYDKIEVTDNSVALCNEVFYTSKIEGAKTTLLVTQHIHDGKYTATSDFSENMIASGFKATKYLNVIGNRLDLDVLLKVWDILVEGACQNSSIRGERFRTGNVQVGKHVGLNPQLLDDAMSNWVNYYNSSTLNDHPFIKAALLHFAFEFIHPFCDGNGRCGRLLMNNFLIGQGYDKIKAISFSRSIEQYRLEYDVALAAGDNTYADCTKFIEFILTMMRLAMTDALEGRLDVVAEN